MVDSVSFFAVSTCLHRPAYKDARMLTRAAHISMPGVILSHRAEKDRCVKLMALQHDLGTGGDDIARGQRVLMPAVPWAKPIAYGNDVEFKRHAARGQYAGLDLLG